MTYKNTNTLNSSKPVWVKFSGCVGFLSLGGEGEGVGGQGAGVCSESAECLQDLGHSVFLCQITFSSGLCFIVSGELIDI